MFFLVTIYSFTGICSLLKFETQSHWNEVWSSW